MTLRMKYSTRYEYATCGRTTAVCARAGMPKHLFTR